MYELLDGDGGDKGSDDELVARLGVFDAQALDVEPLGFQGAEQLFDRPAAAVEIDDLPGLQDIFDGTSGQEPPVENRSEEHTSELQSLMRISYAVFCLKKKK